MKWQATNYGAKWGGLEIERTCSDGKEGWVCLRISSKKHNIYISVLKGGKIYIDDRSTKPAEYKNKESEARDLPQE